MNKFSFYWVVVHFFGGGRYIMAAGKWWWIVVGGSGRWWMVMGRGIFQPFPPRNLVKETWSYSFFESIYTMVPDKSLWVIIRFRNRKLILWLQKDIMRCTTEFYFRTIDVPYLWQRHGSGYKIKSIFICQWLMSHVPT